MSFNFIPLQGSSSTLLKKFGREMTFTRKTDAAFDPATGTKTQTTSTFKKFACVFDYSAEELSLDNIQAGDRRLLAEGHTYLIGDIVSLDSQNYRVISVSNIQPAGTVVACNLQVRK